uniref:DUF1653 domain-containing protein n=1 Tax=Strongyloides papillosus TaxID=174720 RepID=A0A0N5CGV3_STREA
MIELKTILIFFIISIYKTDGHPFYYKKYYAQVMGIVCCRFSQNGTAIAYISESPYSAYEYHLIDFKHIKYNQPFRLYGTITRLRKPGE